MLFSKNLTRSQAHSIASRYLKARITLSLLCLLCVVGLSIRPARAATTLTVNTSTVLQNNFLGIGGVYHGFTYMPESNAKGMTDPLRTLEFDRISALKLSIARTWYGSDWAMPTWGGSYDWNSTKMTAFYQWLQAMKNRNVDVVISAGWWFTQNTCSPAAPSTCTPSIPADVNVYTKWVSDSVYQLVTVKGFTNVKYMTLFTEPLSYTSGNIPAGYSQLSYYEYVANALQTRLVTDGRRSLIKIIGPNGTSLASTTSDLQSVRTDLDNVIDIYSGHDYSLNGYFGWYGAVNNGIGVTSPTGKPFWMDEYGKQDENYRNTADYGTYLAEANVGAINAGAQTTLIWLLQDQYYVYPLDQLTNGDSFYNGLHKWGTQRWLPSDVNVRPSWYAFGLLSRYLGHTGTKIYNSSKFVDGVLIVPAQLSDGNWSIVVVNANTAAADINLSFSSALNRTFYRYLYDPANVPTDNQPISKSKAFANTGTTLNDSLPARSIAIYSTIDDGSDYLTDPNLIRRADLSASSSFESTEFGWGVGKAKDRQRNSTAGSNGWTSDSNNGVNHSETLQAKLDATYPVNKVDLYPRNDTSAQIGQGFPIDFTIQLTTDPTCTTGWTTVVTRTNYARPSNAVQSFSFGATSAACLKVVGTNLRQNPNDGNLYRMQLAELEAYADALPPTSTPTPVPVVNFIAAATLTSSSSFENTSYGWGIAKVKDGGRNSVSGANGWTSDSNTTIDHTEWLQAKLNGSYAVGRVDLYPRNDTSAQIGQGFPLNFTIQVTTDPNCTTGWTTVVTRTNYSQPGNTVQSFSFTPQTAACLKVVGTNLRQNPNDLNQYRMQFAEIEAYTS